MDVPSRLATCISAAEKLRIIVPIRRILHLSAMTTDIGWRAVGCEDGYAVETCGLGGRGRHFAALVCVYTPACNLDGSWQHVG